MIHSLLVRLLLLSAALGLAQEVKPDHSDSEAELAVLVLDSLGKPIQDALMVIERLNVNAPTTRLRSPSCLNLRYGTYRLSVEKSGFSTAVRTLEVSQPRQAVVFGLIPSWIEGGANGIADGKLRDLRDKPKCSWVRLVPLLGATDTLETRATDDGLFRLEGAKPGSYAAVVTGPEGVCSISVISLALALDQPITLSVHSGARE